MSSNSGNIFMVVAPSGAGKSSLVNALLAEDPTLVLSISCTTREPRPGEEANKHYRFVSHDEFKALRESKALLEWAEVHGNFYGTPRDRIDQALSEGRDVLLEIDWQGARQVSEHFPQAVGIFILPPSIEALEIRLTQRGQDAPQVISRRLLAAGSEMSHASECQYVIINQEFSIALQQLGQIIAATRLRYATQAQRHTELFSQLGISKTIA
ncbi:MAG: guanylate kinase [Pusillimonas sp.]